MKRTGKYRDYERRILEYLVTKTTEGDCPRIDLARYCKIPPKGSMNNVLNAMEQESLVVQKAGNWVGKGNRVLITDQGRRRYADIIAKPAEYGLPYHVRKYLDQRVPPIKKLHPFQEDFVNRGLLHARDNVCVFAYPASGKTLIAEMAMMQAIADGGKALYCTPYKALDWQKYEDFSRSFSRLGAKVQVTDGDNPIKSSELEEADIVIGTYERIVGAVRRRESWLSHINLLCADEISLLADRERGGTVDLLLTLMKQSRRNLRIISLCSIVGNALSIAKWLDSKPVIENRPLPGTALEESVVYNDRKQVFFLPRNGNETHEPSEINVIQHLVKRNLAAQKTTLIFVGPRDTTRQLAEDLKILHLEDPELAKLVDDFMQSSSFERTLLTSQLCELLKFGVAFHHAGLHKRVRRFVEKLLSEGKLKTIVATGTLSHGIDYKIDSVIISYRSIESVHPLFCYEYINYKGRAGRFGKSLSADTYIVCDKSEAQEIFTKYFLSQPEEIYPPSVFEAEEVATMALAAAAEGDVTSSDAKRVVEETLWAMRNGGRIPIFNQVLRELCQAGFLEKDGNRYSLTKLGRMTNESNLSPFDVYEVAKLGRSSTLIKLLSTAAKTDMVRRYRERGARGKADPTNMLLDWIDEMPIDSIRDKYNDYYDDGDILLLGEYAAITLQKICFFMNDKRTRKLIELLIQRSRCGVREDIVRNGFTKLTVVARDKARPLARALVTNGYRDLGQLSKSSPSKLAKKLSMTEDQAISLIADCKNALKKW